VGSKNPFGTHGNIKVDIRDGNFGAAGLELADFDAASSAQDAASITNSPSSGWYSSNLGNSNLGYINLMGNTQFRLRFNTDDNDDGGADYLLFYSGNAGSANRPKLVIKYYMP
jgi:hypothetical protein